MMLGDYFSSVPTWLWVVGGVVLLAIVFGERTLWEYEVKFPRREGIGRGEVELECGSKSGSRIECEFVLEPACRKLPLEIHLNGQKIFEIPADKNVGRRLFLKEKIQLDRPKEGDHLSVVADGEALFEGPLVLD